MTCAVVGEEYTADVVIASAGPAGSTAATILAGRGWNVLLADRAAFPRDKTCGDGLTPRAMPVLERLGLLPQLSRGSYQLVHGARLIAPNGTEWHLRFADYGLGLPPFGLVIPRFELDQQLCRHAVAQGADFRPGFHIQAPLYEGKTLVGVQGTLNGQSLRVQASADHSGYGSQHRTAPGLRLAVADATRHQRHQVTSPESRT